MCLNYALVTTNQDYHSNPDSRKRKVHFDTSFQGPSSSLLPLTHPEPNPNFGIKTCLRKKPIQDGKGLSTPMEEDSDEEERALEPEELTSYEQRHPLKKGELPGKSLRKRILSQLKV